MTGILDDSIQEDKKVNPNIETPLDFRQEITTGVVNVFIFMDYYDFHRLRSNNDAPGIHSSIHQGI